MEIQFQSQSELLIHIKERIIHHRHWVQKQFSASPDNALELTVSATQFTDHLIKIIYHHFFGDSTQSFSIVSVGGYGRSELLPFSDIDLLLLASDDFINRHEQSITDFVTFLWDTKLDIGHSVRTIQTCIEEAKADISTATSFLETRFICGNTGLFDQLNQALTAAEVFSSQDFYQAKVNEQRNRHHKLIHTEYNLEPNVKNSPGGLRDIQTILWILKQHFEFSSQNALVKLGFLSQEDLTILNNGHAFLIKIRFALHIIANRKQDRLLFDYQKSIADLLGFEDDKKSLGVEKMMKQYYRWVLALSELNEMLLQLFNETVLQHNRQDQIKTLNQRFQTNNDFIEAKTKTLFQQTPSALLEVFLLMCQDPSIKGVRAQTIRQIRDHRFLIGDQFINDPINQALFVNILRSQARVDEILDMMRRYGILGKLISDFGLIIGQTQLDLFHVYSVDAHTMMVLRYMHSFNDSDSQQEFPLAYKVMANISRKELLYLACLFHDIGKGQGGDHSLIGADFALQFCAKLGFHQQDCELVSWLVQYHLLLSQTAQKKDLSDPEIIYNFAKKMTDRRHLDYLFLLTVADINGTNPELWNSWRASLIYQLYEETRKTLSKGLDLPIETTEVINQKKQKASALLSAQSIDQQAIDDFWGQAGENYFACENVDDIVWHTQHIVAQKNKQKSLVFMRNIYMKGSDKTVTQLFIYTLDKLNIFAKVTRFLEQKQLSIASAHVYSSPTGFTLDTFLILNANGQALDNEPTLFTVLCEQLEAHLDDEDVKILSTQKRPTRQQKFFKIPTETHFSNDEGQGFSLLEVTTADRPGLLALIGEVFTEYKIALVAAKIATLGEKVEDVFHIVDKNGLPITNPQLISALRQTVCSRLDQQIAQSG